MIRYVLSFLLLFLIGCFDDDSCVSSNAPFIPSCECLDTSECEDGYRCIDNECRLILNEND